MRAVENSTRPKKRVVLHVLQSLGVGGAETQLCHWLRHSDKDKLEHHVFTFGALGPLQAVIEHELKIPVNEFRHTLPVETDEERNQLVYDYAKRLGADVIQARTTGIFYTEKAALLNKPIFWRLGDKRNIQEYAHEPKKQTLLMRAAEVSAKIPTGIVCTSETVRDVFVQDNGFDSKKMLVVTSGVDGELFKPNPEARSKIRAELGIDDNTPLIGIVARNDPAKDFPTFFAAAEEMHKRHPEVRFVIAGRGQNPTSEQKKYIFFLDQRADIPDIAAALDIGTSSSLFEAPGQTLIEMGACGIPCVVTDVQDMRKTVGNTGVVVPCKQPRLMADAWELLLTNVAQRRAEIALETRAHIIQNYGIKTMVKSYDDLCLNMLGKNTIPR